MRRILSVWGVCWLLFAGGAARAADDPRAVIERGIKALGGADVLRQKAAIQVKVKGKSEASPGMPMPLTGEALMQPGGAIRMDLQLEVSGNPIKITAVVDGSRSWMRAMDQLVPVPKEMEKQYATASVCQRAIELLPLLEDKSFTLAALPEEKVDDRPAVGVKVSYNKELDIKLYFDRETGLPVKYVYRAPVLGMGELLHERVLSDFRDVRADSAAERVLRAAGVDASDRGVLEFLRSRTRGKELIEKARLLIRKLGDDSFTVREKATRDLIALGSVALPFLREAAKEKDPEVARRASLCLEQIKEDNSGGVLPSAVRLVAVRRPPGSVAALLDLLPGADEPLVREIKAALYAQVQATAKPDEALVRALDDSDLVRRAAASAVLGKDGGAYLREPRRRVYLRLPRVPMKTRDYVDGKLQMEIEYAEPECFNRFDPKEFAKP
jgi:hypothetical protein